MKADLDRLRAPSRWLDALLVAFVTVVVFLPGVFGEFVGWDDDRNFLENEAYRGLGWRHLGWMWTTFHMGHYKPVTWLSHGLDHALSGMNPRGYHAFSIVLHAATAVAFLLLARRLLTLALPGARDERAVRLGAVAAALVFSVHPLRVEAVSWITGRGDVLSTLFAVLAVVAYLRACESAGPAIWRRSWYWTSVGAFALALLGKSMVVSLPLILLVLDVYPLGRLGGARGWPGRIFIEKVPFFALSLAASIVAVLARIEFGSLMEMREIGLVPRLAAAVYGPAFYLWKSVAPLNLSPLYEFKPLIRGGPWPFLLSTGLVGALTILAFVRRRQWPALGAVWAVYLAILLPVSGLAQNGPQIAADRYSYFACLGWAVLFGAAIAWCAEQWSRRATAGALRAGLLGAATALVLSLAGLTAGQILVWQDSTTLWRHAVRVDPQSAISRVGLGVALLSAGQIDQAAPEFARAVELHPPFPQARLGLAYTLALTGKADQALPHAVEAVRLNPREARFHLGLADILWRHDRREDAVAWARRAARLQPSSASIRYELTLMLAETGRVEEAAALLEDARRLRPAPDPEADRVEALIYTGSDRARAIAAWERYLAAAGRVRNPTRGQADRIMAAFTALAELQRGRPPAGTGK